MNDFPEMFSNLSSMLFSFPCFPHNLFGLTSAHKATKLFYSKSKQICLGCEKQFQSTLLWDFRSSVACKHPLFCSFHFCSKFKRAGKEIDLMDFVPHKFCQCKVDSILSNLGSSSRSK